MGLRPARRGEGNFKIALLKKTNPNREEKSQEQFRKNKEQLKMMKTNLRKFEKICHFWTIFAILGRPGGSRGALGKVLGRFWGFWAVQGRSSGDLLSIPIDF